MKLTEYVEDLKAGTADQLLPILQRSIVKDGKVLEYNNFQQLIKTWTWEDFKKYVPDGECLQHNYLGKMSITYSMHRKWRCPHINKVKISEEKIDEKPTNVKTQCTFCGEFSARH